MHLIINNSYNKHSMSWELIHHRLLHPSNSVIKSMCLQQTITKLPKELPKKINHATCTICYSEKITTLPKGTTVDTN